MADNSELTPILKWVGGKRQILDKILPFIPEHYSTYYEPFVGGGAVFFALHPKKAVLNDLNSELINVYIVIKTNAKLLIEELDKHSKQHSKEHFYYIRALDRNKTEYDKLSDVQKAARTIYLNKTCYNGLYRVNANGEFNTPFGKYKNPNILNEKCILAISKYLQEADIRIKCGDYRKILSSARKGAFVYFDPPYMPVSTTSNFTNYTASGFTIEQQVELKQTCDDLDRRGIKFLLSNANTAEIRRLYAGYRIKVIKAKRAINSVGNKRGVVEEVLVRNYD